MPDNHTPTPDVPTGWPTEPPYVRPAWLPAPQQHAPMDTYGQPYGGGQQPIVIHNHYASPPQQRRGLDVQTVLGWTAALGVVAGVLLAVAMAAVAIGLAALAMALMALVLRQLWRDLRGGK